MGPYYYIITSIEGEYAILKRTDTENEDTINVALFLLPQGSDIGTKLKYENMEYSVI